MTKDIGKNISLFMLFLLAELHYLESASSLK